MLKRTKLSIASTICYAIFVLGGGAMALYMTYLIAKNNAEGGSAGFGALGYAILLILGAGYAIAGILPLIFHTIDIFKNKKLLAGLCIPFDLLFLGFNGACVFSTVTEPTIDAKSVAFAAALLLVSLVAFVANIISLKCSSYE